tara:strand:+ start:182 stop:715 length:534 start_codon:yes stop_codon:yes gene_type:complete
MENLSTKDKKEKLNKTLLPTKNFDLGMYQFIMFQIDYYARVKKQLKLDYDSFIIVQTVVSHCIYNLRKNYPNKKSYTELEDDIEKMIRKMNFLKNTKLTLSSICLVTNQAKETVRRKVNILLKKNFLTIDAKVGIILGPKYKKVYNEFVPTTTFEIKKLLKGWKKNGTLESFLEFDK